MSTRGGYPAAVRMPARDDIFAGGYWARQVRFLLDHAPEIDSPSSREKLRREFVMLGRYQRCRCGRTFEPAPQTAGRAVIYTAGTPTSPILLDLQRAYAAMPSSWPSTTEVWLLLNGSTEAQIQEMRDRGAFLHEHRSHVAVRRDPQLPMRWRGTPWESIAGFLRGREDIAA